MSLIDGITSVASDVTNVLDDVASLASNPMANTLTLGMTSSLSLGGSLLNSILDETKKQHELTRSPRDQRHGKGECEGKGKGKGGCGESEGAGGSVFERIALAMGEAMDKKLNQLLEASEQVANLSDDLSQKAQKNGGQLNDADKFAGEGGIMKASAQVTARGQELNAISQAFNSAINSLGQAASNAARKT
jgi:hypothetical protein